MSKSDLVWSKNGVYAGSIYWINTIKEPKDKRLDSWGLGEILKNQMRNEHLKEFIDQRLFYMYDYKCK